MNDAHSDLPSIEDQRRKWSEIPIADRRRRSSEMLQLSDVELRAVWDAMGQFRQEGAGFGWWTILYREAFRHKRILEIGSGGGYDGITFLREGAFWTFSDIVDTNLALVKRNAQINNVDLSRANFVYIDSLRAFDRLQGEFDFIWANGSLINLPFSEAKVESLSALAKLKVGGRWIELCYPPERWMREGSQPFMNWGSATDGAGTPWVEWYDLPKLTRRLYPAKLTPVLSMNFSNDAFNWFDLLLKETLDVCLLETSEPEQMVALTDAQPCNNCAIETSSQRLFVRTQPALWSYAAFVPIPASMSRKPRLTIEFEHRVVEGSIGFGVVDKDLQFVGAEKILDFGSTGAQTIESQWPGAAAGIIIRNTSGNGASLVEVTGITLRMLE